MSSSDYESQLSYPDYKIACELGYELSKSDFKELTEYSKKVRSEVYYRNELSSCGPFQRSLSNSSSKSNFSSNEDLWIQYLRSFFDSGSNKYSIIFKCVCLIIFRIATPEYVRIKDNENQVLNEIRKRRLASLEVSKILPSEAISLITNNLSLPDSTEIIQKFFIPIAVKDLKTLMHPNWLNDEIINFYFELLRERSKNESKYPRLHIFNTFFYSNLQSKGYSSVKRWTKNVNIFAFDIILIPIHLGIHWCCAEINLKAKSIIYYDSLHNSNSVCLNLLRGYLIEEFQDKIGGNDDTNFDFSNWNLISPKGIPCQQNGYDCGVFACVFAEHRSRDSEFGFTQKDMKYYRKRISFEIIKGKLL